MASISTDKKNGRRTVQFVAADRKRRSIRLGKVSKRQADAVKLHVERLVAANITGHAVADETSRWLAAIEESRDVLVERLARVGLIELPAHLGDNKIPETLQAFLDSYFATFGESVKQSTVTTWKQARRLALEHFDAETPISSITVGHAVEFRAYLKTRDHSRIKRARKLSESTIRRRCGCLSQIFEHAVSLELIAKNPFASKRVPKSLPKPKQKHHILHDHALSIMEELPHAQWRLLFALTRWGGLRVPSEPRLLRWSDIDWALGRMIVHSPKTAHTGRDKRIIPIFPELVTPLQEVWDTAEQGTDHVLEFMRGKSQSAFRKPLIAAIEAAGRTVWPKLFTALRATRDTELRDLYPSHVVDAWIGHEENVAKHNYLQLTAEHFTKAVQIPVQYPAASLRAESQITNAISKKHHGVPLDAESCDALRTYRVGEEGLEPPTSAL